MKRKRISIAVTLECAGNGRTMMKPRCWTTIPWENQAIGTAIWTGTPLKDILEECGVLKSAVDIIFTGKDKGLQDNEVQYYQRSLSVKDSMFEDIILAYMMNGQPLSPQHGFPLRLIVPGWYGMASVKWLDSIKIVDSPFDGVQMRSYRYRKSNTDNGVPLTTMNVKSLMIPPGIPEFFNRERFLEAGSVTLEGRAWTGGGRQITRVEVSVDGGNSFHSATLEDSSGKYNWRKWTFHWKAEVGKHTLLVKAIDDIGNEQPLQEDWNMGGFANNAVQRVEVNVMQKIPEGLLIPTSFDNFPRL